MVVLGKLFASLTLVSMLCFTIPLSCPVLILWIPNVILAGMLFCPFGMFIGVCGHKIVQVIAAEQEVEIVPIWS